MRPLLAGFLLLAFARLYPAPIVSLSHAAEIAVPTLTGPVVDEANVINDSQRALLTDKLLKLQQTKGSQVVVLTVSSLHGASIEEYAYRVASKWQLGRKGVDDGALLVVAPQEKNVRIEVGRGLEGILPDVVAFRIIDQRILPLFKEGQIGDGIVVGVDSILAAIAGEPLPLITDRDATNDDAYIIFLLFFTVMAGSVLAALLGRRPAAIITGIVSFTVALAITSLVIALIIGLFAFMTTLFPGAGSRRGRWNHGGGFSIGHSSDGFDGGFGGFSGGGGSFSGGGASGRW